MPVGGALLQISRVKTVRKEAIPIEDETWEEHILGLFHVEKGERREHKGGDAKLAVKTPNAQQRYLQCDSSHAHTRVKKEEGTGEESRKKGWHKKTQTRPPKKLKIERQQ